MKKRISWKYTSVQHGPRIALGIDCNWYSLFDFVYKRQSHPSTSVGGYSDESYKSLSEALMMGVGTVHAAMKQGEQWGLVEFHPDSNRLKRMTSKWYDNVYTNDDRFDHIEKLVKSKPKKTKKADVQIPNVQIPNENVQIPNGKRSDSERTPIYSNNSKEGNNESLASQAGRVIDFFNEHLGRGAKKRFRGEPTKAVGWISKHLKKYSVDECCNAIILKSMQWSPRPEMAQHLKLVTLFKNHGDEYILEAIEALEDENFQRVIIDAVNAIKKNNSSSAGITAGQTTSKHVERLAKMTNQ